MDEHDYSTLYQLYNGSGGRVQKGSQEAKEKMAMLRARKHKKGGKRNTKMHSKKMHSKKMHHAGLYVAGKAHSKKMHSRRHKKLNFMHDDGGFVGGIRKMHSKRMSRAGNLKSFIRDFERKSVDAAKRSLLKNKGAGPLKTVYNDLLKQKAKMLGIKLTKGAEHGYAKKGKKELALEIEMEQHKNGGFIGGLGVGGFVGGLGVGGLGGAKHHRKSHLNPLADLVM